MKNMFLQARAIRVAILLYTRHIVTPGIGAPSSSTRQPEGGVPWVTTTRAPTTIQPRRVSRRELSREADPYYRNARLVI